MKTVTARNIQYVFGEKTTFQNHAEFSFVMLLYHEVDTVGKCDCIKHILCHSTHEFFFVLGLHIFYKEGNTPVRQSRTPQ